MATYTTNYNLSKPENTDSQEDFIDAYCDNMDIIDQNMGGGGGGGGATMLLNTIYSDVEKKIGYWRDNKPLYQKTIIDTIVADTWKVIDVSSLNIDFFSFCDCTTLVESTGNMVSYGAYFGNKDEFNAYYDRAQNSIYVKEVNSVIAGTLYITIRYTKTTDTPEPNPEFGNTIYLPTIYSEEEKEVGVWIDNKPLYQKTLTGNSDPNSTSIRVNVSALNLDTICNAYLVTNSSTANTQDYYYDNADHLRWYYDDKVNEYLTIEYGSSYPSRPFEWRLTLQYTKTTDTAGSGTWTVEGAIAEHYKTNEQVVGTWFGDTLYQATIQTAIPNNTQVNYPHGIANIDKIVGIEGGAWDGSQYLPINMTGYVSGNNEGALRVTATKTDIAILPLSWDGSSYTGYWTIRYTKTV